MLKGQWKYKRGWFWGCELLRCRTWAVDMIWRDWTKTRKQFGNQFSK